MILYFSATARILQMKYTLDRDLIPIQKKILQCLYVYFKRPSLTKTGGSFSFCFSAKKE